MLSTSGHAILANTSVEIITQKPLLEVSELERCALLHRNDHGVVRNNDRTVSAIEQSQVKARNGHRFLSPIKSAENRNRITLDFDSCLHKSTPTGCLSCNSFIFPRLTQVDKINMSYFSVRDILVWYSRTRFPLDYQ